MRYRLMVAIVAAVTAAGLPAHPAAQEPGMAEVLKTAAAYVAEFQAHLSGIASEETYVQEVTPLAGRSSGGALMQRRVLKSDLLLVKPAGVDRYVEFRDVFEVDGRPVRERGERLSELLRQPWNTASSQMSAIINESARYNIGPIQRNVNTPLLAMLFLDASLQSKFKFKRASKARSQPNPVGVSAPVAPTVEHPVFRASTEMWPVEFEERERQTIIRTPDGRPLPARGRFWLNPATGAVLISELVLTGGGVNTTITVSYQSEPLMGFMVPVEMRESYIGARERVAGAATYGRFRQIVRQD